MLNTYFLKVSCQDIDHRDVRLLDHDQAQQARIVATEVAYSSTSDYVLCMWDSYLVQALPGVHRVALVACLRRRLPVQESIDMLDSCCNARLSGQHGPIEDGQRCNPPGHADKPKGQSVGHPSRPLHPPLLGIHKPAASEDSSLSPSPYDSSSEPMSPTDAHAPSRPTRPAFTALQNSSPQDFSRGASRSPYSLSGAFAYAPKNTFLSSSHEPSSSSPKGKGHSPNSAPPSDPQQSQQGLVFTSRRNEPVATALPTADDLVTIALGGQCPFCPYARRAADVRRHLQTHFAREVLWVCCGVPLAQAALYRVPEEVVESGARIEHGGQVMVGGCGKVLSRRDALQRHLNKLPGKCTGDVMGPWLKGNQVGAR